MTDDLKLQPLERLAHRESKSLLQYVVRAFPWTTAAQDESLSRLRDIIQQESDALGALVRYLLRHRIAPPHSGGYPMDFTALNFLDIGYLAGLLVKEQEENIAAIEADLKTVPAGEGKHLAETILALKKKHLEQFKQLQKPEPVVTS